MYTERISTAARFNLYSADLQQSQANFDRLTAQLASGKKVQNLTDDPIAAVNIINTNRQLGQLETFATNVELGMKELDTLDDLLSLASGYLSNAWDKAVQANSQTYGVESLKALKVEIDQITKTMVDLANTEYNDNYIFGGANTKILPYSIDEATGEIIYHGTKQTNPDYIRQTEVADGVFEVINTTGDKVFGWYEEGQATDADGNLLYKDADGKIVTEVVDQATGNKIYSYEDGTIIADQNVIDALEPKENYAGVFGALKCLSNSIQKVIDGDVETGYEEMNKTLDMFANSLTEMTTEQTKFGGVYNRLEMTTATLESNNESLTALLSEIQDVDIAKAVSEWYQAQYAYQASLKVTSSSMGMSLLNYI